MASQRQIPDQLSAFVRRLTLSQKLTIAAVTVGTIAALIALVTVVNRPTYAPLFST